MKWKDKFKWLEYKDNKMFCRMQLFFELVWHMNIDTKSVDSGTISKL